MIKEKSSRPKLGAMLAWRLPHAEDVETPSKKIVDGDSIGVTPKIDAKEGIAYEV